MDESSQFRTSVNLASDDARSTFASDAINFYSPSTISSVPSLNGSFDPRAGPSLHAYTGFSPLSISNGLYLSPNTCIDIAPIEPEGHTSSQYHHSLSLGVDGHSAFGSATNRPAALSPITSWHSERIYSTCLNPSAGPSLNACRGFNTLSAVYDPLLSQNTYPRGALNVLDSLCRPSMSPPGASDLSTIGSTVNIHCPPTGTSVVSRDFFTENSDLVTRNDEECREASHIEAEQGDNEKYLASEPDHESIQSATPYTCRQCGESFESQTDLNYHALGSKHGSYECRCGQKFPRSDVIRRHLDRYRPAIERYSCRLSPRYRGDRFSKKVASNTAPSRIS